VQLVRFHEKAKAIDHDSAGILKGALMYQTKRVREVMTPLEKCFMLREDTPLNFEVISQVFQLGHSRIPVYSENASRNPPSDPDDIVGLLFTKDLILVDPEEATKVKNVVNFFSRTIHKVPSDQQLGQLLNNFKEGNTHISMVVEVNTENPDIDPFYELKGIVTLEDVIEEILGSEILDETDQFIHIEKEASEIKQRKRFDFAQLRLWDAQRKKNQALEEGQVTVVTTLLLSKPQFQQKNQAGAPLTTAQVRKLVRESSLQKFSNSEQIYKLKQKDDFFSLVMDGELDVVANGDQRKANKFQVVAGAALNLEGRGCPFVSDFTATVSSETCHLLRISRDDFFRLFDEQPVIANLDEETKNPAPDAGPAPPPSLPDAEPPVADTETFVTMSEEREDVMLCVADTDTSVTMSEVREDVML